MKYIPIFLLLTAMLAFPERISAQAGLEINKVFTDSYRNLKGATETLIVKENLHNLNLTTYHSMTIKGHKDIAETIEKLVAADARKSKMKIVRYRSGHIYYGLYQLAGVRKGESRYIIFLNGPANGDDRIIVLYLEGASTFDQVKKLLN